jgi:hypothetical protein
VIAMQPFWDVLFADARGLALFAAPMLLMGLPASALGGLLGSRHAADRISRRLRSSIGQGMLLGTAAALAISMLVEFSLKAEGFSEGRRALRDSATWQLCLAAPIVALGCGFFAARRFAAVPPAERRRYTLRQLFVGQLIAGLLFGWWAFTRRDEISLRRAELAWQARDREAKAVFQPLGWQVLTWPDHDETVLASDPWNPPRRPVSDEALIPISLDGSVTRIGIVSDAITDAGLAHLEGSNRLRVLQLTAPQVSDAGLARISHSAGDFGVWRGAGVRERRYGGLEAVF